jgi:hypothetical protein
MMRMNSVLQTCSKYWMLKFPTFSGYNVLILIPNSGPKYVLRASPLMQRPENPDSITRTVIHTNTRSQSYCCGSLSTWIGRGTWLMAGPCPMLERPCACTLWWRNDDSRKRQKHRVIEVNKCKANTIEDNVQYRNHSNDHLRLIFGCMYNVSWNGTIGFIG